MKMTLNIDPKLLVAARAACGAATDTAAVREGLKALVTRRAYEDLLKFTGSEPDAQDVPRRRFP